MRPVHRVLALLEGVRPGGGGWSARCPAHDDKNPSLSVAEGDDGRVLLHCHAGCDAEAICAAIGLNLGGLYPPSPNRSNTPRSFASAEDAARAIEGWIRSEKPGWKLTASYPYPDPTGREVMRVLRFEPEGGGDKTFRPVHSRDGVWHIGDPPGPLPLYRLPVLPAATVVGVLEGEKAADAAAALGLVTTTSAHGAGAAKRTDWSPLAGKGIAIFPDKDEAGCKYALEVAGIVLRLNPPGRVKIVDLPGLSEHGDIVEFIAARRATGIDDDAIRAEIERLVEAAPAFVGSGGAPGEASAESHPPSGSSVGAHPGPVPEFGEPEPLPRELPSVDRFDPWMLPRALLAWIVDIAKRIQCPMDFPAVAAMVAFSSVVGRKVGIRPKQRDDWLVVPNLWGALIGRPGIMKTPPLQEATRPLKRMEIEAKKAFETESERYEAELMVFEARKKAAQGDIKKDLKAKDDGGALAAAQDVLGSEPVKPLRRRRLVNDSTVEKLGEILNENPNGVLGLRDELIGQLRNLDKEGQESARAFYLEAWNGTGRFTYDRIGRGTVDIEAAIISILGSIQPGPLGGYLREAVEGGKGDDGLMSRFQLAVWPDVTPEWKNVDAWPDTEAKNTAYGVFTWLDKLTAEDVEAGQEKDDDDGIPYLRFDPRAQRVFDRWRGGLERRLRSGEEHPALESHFAKYRSLIPSLALLIHLADGGKGPVGLDSLRKALAWGRYLSSHARRVYAVAVMDDVGAAKRLVARIRKGQVKDGFTERDVYRNDWSGLDRDSVRKAVAVLVEHGWLRGQVEETEGRSKKTYWINPRILGPAPEATDETDRGASTSVHSPPEVADGTDGSGAEQHVSQEPPSEPTDTTDRSSGDEWGRV